MHMEVALSGPCVFVRRHRGAEGQVRVEHPFQAVGAAVKPLGQEGKVNVARGEIAAEAGAARRDGIKSQPAFQVAGLIKAGFNVCQGDVAPRPEHYSADRVRVKIGPMESLAADREAQVSGIVLKISFIKAPILNYQYP